MPPAPKRSTISYFPSMMAPLSRVLTARFDLRDLGTTHFIAPRPGVPAEPPRRDAAVAPGPASRAPGAESVIAADFAKCEICDRSGFR
jgi:hypothetical protein